MWTTLVVCLNFGTNNLLRERPSEAAANYRRVIKTILSTSNCDIVILGVLPRSNNLYLSEKMQMEKEDYIELLNCKIRVLNSHLYELCSQFEPVTLLTHGHIFGALTEPEEICCPKMGYISKVQEPCLHDKSFFSSATTPRPACAHLSHNSLLRLPSRRPPTTPAVPTRRSPISPAVSPELRHFNGGGHDNVRVWLCDICGAKFKDEISYFEHKKRCLSSPTSSDTKVDKLACTKCLKQFSKKFNLSRHSLTCDPNLKIMYPRTCEMCSKVLTDKTTFSKHKTICGDNTASSTKIACSKCHKLFKNKFSLHSEYYSGSKFCLFHELCGVAEK